MDANTIKYLALQELGYNKQPDFNGEGDFAVDAINLNYEHMYNLSLTSFNWEFCSAFTELQGEATDNERYKYVFELPEDLLHLRGTYTNDTGAVLRDYFKNGNKIYANYETVYIRYTQKVNEENLPSSFVEYLKYKLAGKLCQTLTGDKDLLQLLMAREQEAFNVAKNQDINQRPPVILPMDVFINERY